MTTNTPQVPDCATLGIRHLGWQDDETDELLCIRCGAGRPGPQQIAPGETFTAKAGARSRLATYVVLRVATNGSVYARNVKTGKERNFPFGIASEIRDRL